MFKHIKSLLPVLFVILVSGCSTNSSKFWFQSTDALIAQGNYKKALKQLQEDNQQQDAIYKKIQKRDTLEARKLMQTIHGNINQKHWGKAKSNLKKLKEYHSWQPQFSSIEKKLISQKANERRLIETELALSEAQLLDAQFSLLDFEKRVSNSSWSIKEMQLTHNKNKLASYLYELSIDAIAAQDYERARNAYNQALKLNNQLHQSALSKSINEGIKKPNQNAILDRQTSLLNALNLALEKYDYDQIINLQSILTNAPFKGPAVKKAIKQANATRQKQAKRLDKQADAVYRQGKVTDAIKLWKEAEKLAPSLTTVQDKLARANRVHKKLIKLRAITEQ